MPRTVKTRAKSPAKDTRTKAEKAAAKRAWAIKRAQQLKRLSEVKRKYGGREYDPHGAEITEDRMIHQLQNLLVNDNRNVSSQALEMGLSPGTVSRMRYGLTRNPSSRTLLRMMNAKGIALKGTAEAPRRRP